MIPALLVDCLHRVNSIASLKLEDVHTYCDALEVVLEARKHKVEESANRDARLIAHGAWLSLQRVVGSDKVRVPSKSIGRWHPFSFPHHPP